MSRAKAKRQPQAAYPPQLRQRIEAERRRLTKASAVLGCLVYAANHDAEDLNAGDVASVAGELIEHAIEALDSVALTQR